MQRSDESRPERLGRQLQVGDDGVDLFFANPANKATDRVRIGALRETVIAS